MNGSNHLKILRQLTKFNQKSINGQGTEVIASLVILQMMEEPETAVSVLLGLISVAY